MEIYSKKSVNNCNKADIFFVLICQLLLLFQRLHCIKIHSYFLDVCTILRMKAEHKLGYNNRW